MKTRQTPLQETWATLRTAQNTTNDDTGRRRFSPDVFWISGLETLAPGDRYHWDGQRRGSDPARPFVVFQVTLDGHGCYETLTENRTLECITPGRAFAAVVPGPHRYFLPDDATEGWTFFWVLLRHPYVVERMAARQRRPGSGRSATVLDLAPDSALLARAVSLFADDYTDIFSEEAAVLAFLIEFERHIHQSVASAGSTDSGTGDALLARARALFLSDPARPLGVVDLARAESMSRTRYSHHFRAATGQPPAQYIARIRLEEVARRLAQTNVTLARIAAETGFADANHLCKAFRRHFHLSPGAYRRQMH